MKNIQKSYSNAKGFTLIELMIVVAIIGILAAVALPAYQDYTTRARVTEGISVMNGIRVGISEAFTDQGIAGMDAYTASITTGGPQAMTVLTDVVTAVNIAPGTGVTTLTLGGIPQLQATANTLVYTPFILNNTTLANAQNGAIQWACSSATQATAMRKFGGMVTAGSIPTQFVPAECR